MYQPKLCRSLSHRLLLAASLLLIISVPPVAAQNLEEIVNKHIAARGGSEKWRSLRTFSQFSRSPGWAANRYWKAPNRVRVDVPIEFPEPGIDVRAFDGSAGWRINPMEGSTEPRHMSAREVAELQEEFTYFRELIDYKAKGVKVELIGKETAGAPAFKLKLTMPSGEVCDIFLDAKTFLEVKRVRRVRAPWGEDREITQVLGDYQEVGGLVLPHRINDTVIEYKVNEPMDDAGFKMPQKKDEGQKSGEARQEEADNLVRLALSPDGRVQLLTLHPEADRDKDGKLSLEEAWGFAKSKNGERRLLRVGSLAPQWTLKDASGKAHRLSDYRGKVVVLDFWATWCIPCHRAMPGMQKLHEELAKRGVVVIGVSTFEKGGDPVQLMKDRRYTYGLLLNGETVAEAYGVAGLPTIYVIGVDGRIIHAGGGANEVAERRRQASIEEYLKKQGM